MSKKGARHADRQFRDPVGDWMVNLERFYSKHGPQDPQTGCIPWTGVKNNIGYPFIGVRDSVTDKYKMVTGHRLALAIKLGRAIAPGMNANHSCHRKDCVNPDHLEEGTQREKLTAMLQAGIKGGRAPGKAGGYDHKQKGRVYKYTEEEIQWTRDATILEIRQRYNITHDEAIRKRSYMRSNYLWLPWTKTK